MILFAWLYVSGFAITVIILCKHDLPFAVRELLRYEISDDLPEWALPLVILIVAFFTWPFLLIQIKR